MSSETEITTALLPSAEHLATEWDTRDETVQWGTAITLAEMSTLAYSTSHNRKLVLRLLGFDRIRLLDDGPRSGFVACAGDKAVIAFRGTDDLADWFANIDFREQRSLTEGRTVHAGFQECYDAFSGEIQQQLAEWAPTRLWVTGHSLGGAMAACCAVDLLDNGIPITGVVTFGQPRIGNHVLATQLDRAMSGRYMRFVNEDDVVPLAPPGILWDYWHCGSRIRFRRERLERWYGLALFSSTGPPADGVAEVEPASDSLPDGEESLTEEELRKVQDYLKKQEQLGDEDGIPGEVGGASAGSGSQSGACAANSSGLLGGIIDSLKKRIHDHTMTEYLRRLNESCSKQGRRLAE